MAVDNRATPEGRPSAPVSPSGEATALLVRRLLRGAAVASLATADRGSGRAYASLVQIASTVDARPVLLVSGLARHTRNLLADPRASLLLDARGDTVDPLAAPRATLVGRACLDASPASLARFLRRYPQAAAYASFADFRLWTLVVEHAHVVAGFGRIEEVSGTDVMLRPSPESATGRLQQRLYINEADVIAELQRALAVESGGSAAPTVTGIDVEGADLDVGGRRYRVEGPTAARDVSDIVSWIARG